MCVNPTYAHTEARFVACRAASSHPNGTHLRCVCLQGVAYYNAASSDSGSGSGPAASSTAQGVCMGAGGASSAAGGTWVCSTCAAVFPDDAKVLLGEATLEQRCVAAGVEMGAEQGRALRAGGLSFADLEPCIAKAVLVRVFIRRLKPCALCHYFSAAWLTAASHASVHAHRCAWELSSTAGATYD